MRVNPKYTQWGAVTILTGATIFTILILVFIIFFILEKGLPVLGLSFLRDG